MVSKSQTQLKCLSTLMHVLKSSCRQGRAPSRGYRGESIPCLFQFLVLPVLLICDHTTPISACVVTVPPSLLCVSNLPLSLRMSLVIVFRAYPDNPAEKAMATHSSILAWRIPGTEEPVGCHLWGHTETRMTRFSSR